MASTPPPSRYRVVERDRRLVVIDTWEKGKAGADTPGPTSAPAQTSAPASAPRPMRPSAIGAMPQRGPATGIGGLLVNLACVGAADGAGRPILTTMEYYDAKGPREIILSEPAARRLGSVLSRTVLVLPVLALILWAFPLLLFLLVGGFWAGISTLNATAKPRVTRWIDGLEAQSAT